MSYEKKLATFTKGNQLSDCKEYNLQDLEDMFSDTQFTNSELYLEDVLTTSPLALSSTVTVMEELKEQGNVFMLLEDDNEVECSAELDYEWANEYE